jgi:hypothetical protein
MKMREIKSILQDLKGEIMIFAFCLVLIIGAYQCGSRGKEQSMRAYKKEQEQKVDSLRAVYDRSIQDIKTRSDAIIKRSEEKVSDLEVKLTEQSKKKVVYVPVKDLVNATDQQLADTMINDYVTRSRTDSAGDVEGIGNTSTFTGQVQIPSQVAAWHIYERRHKEFLLIQNQVADSIIRIWELKGKEFELQIGAFKENEADFRTALESKTMEAEVFRAGQKFMEGKARKYRWRGWRDRIIGGVIIGGITYLVLR